MNTLQARGKYGSVKLYMASRKYKLVAIDKTTKKHYTKYFATEQGALSTFNVMRKTWV